MTIVKLAQGKSFVISDLNNKQNSYEIEVEHMKSSKFDNKETPKELFRLITLLSKLVNDTDFIISNKKKLLLSCQLINLVHPGILHNDSK